LITLNLDIKTAAAVRHVLFQEQKIYTYDSTCVPLRITEIRNLINDLDEQIEEELKNEEHP